MKKTLSRTSPNSSKRGCLCPDGTYSSKCCDGSLQAQGIGSLVGGHTSEIKRPPRAFQEGFSNGFE
jgi:hypothetical protein